MRASDLLLILMVASSGSSSPPPQGGQGAVALPPPRMATAVLADVPALAARGSDAGRATEVTIRWTVGGPAAVRASAAARDVTTSQFDVVQRRTVSLSPARERDPQLTPDDLVVIAVDAQGRELGWQRLIDPRLVRSEQPSATGELRGQVFYRTEADLTVWVPDGSAATTLLIYAADWNGREYALRGLGSVPYSRQ